MVSIQAVLFDLHGSLGYVENPLEEDDIPEYLTSKGYEVSPQSLWAAWMFVSFIDYPKYGYSSWRSYLSRILWRLRIKIDKETLRDAIRLLEQREVYKLYPDAAEAVVRAKETGFKTAIVTTIAHFKFEEAIEPIRKHLDFIMTGAEAGVDKSNPRMYKKVLQILQVSPKQAVMIGDNCSIDVLLPKRLGMKAILLDRENSSETCNDADAIVNDLSEALDVVLTWR